MTKTYFKESPETIKSLFNSIASDYDRANSIMSLRMHALWNQRLVNEIFKDVSPTCALDLCAGTGEIAKRMHTKAPTAKIHLVDFSEAMLRVAKKNCGGENFYFHEQDVQVLSFNESQFDCATMAYGIRNVKNVQSCFLEVFRVLKKGSHFAILELTRPENYLLRMMHKAYLHTALPLVGRVCCKNKDAYSYLCTSIQNFTSPVELVKLLQLAGFCSVRTISLHFGIATIIVAKKD